MWDASYDAVHNRVLGVASNFSQTDRVRHGLTDQVIQL